MVDKKDITRLYVILAFVTLCCFGIPRKNIEEYDEDEQSLSFDSSSYPLTYDDFDIGIQDPVARIVKRSPAVSDSKKRRRKPKPFVPRYFRNKRIKAKRQRQRRRRRKQQG